MPYVFEEDANTTRMMMMVEDKDSGVDGRG